MAGALCNNDKMRLGLFAPNISQACAATTAEGHLELTRAHPLPDRLLALSRTEVRRRGAVAGQP